MPADATATLTADGPAQTVSTTVGGQNAMFTFAGTAGAGSVSGLSTVEGQTAAG